MNEELPPVIYVTDEELREWRDEALECLREVKWWEWHPDCCMSCGDFPDGLRSEARRLDNACFMLIEDWRDYLRADKEEHEDSSD